MPASLLALLAAQSAVACDTLDPAAVAALGPFAECTSNQAIALAELRRPENAPLLGTIFETTQRVRARFAPSATAGGLAGQAAADPAPPRDPSGSDSGSSATVEGLDGAAALDMGELAVQVAMVVLARRMAPHVAGSVHVQANPKHAYDTPRTVADGVRLVELFREVDRLAEAERGGAALRLDSARVVIKVPATWEGLQACRALQARGIRTLATTLFALEQAQLAGEVGCAYVAPYVNELKVHFEPGYQDPAPALDLPAQAQRYFAAHGMPTAVMPASLVSAHQCMQMAGISHVTIAPALLRELARTPVAAASAGALGGDYTPLALGAGGLVPAVGDLIGAEPLVDDVPGMDGVDAQLDAELDLLAGAALVGAPAGLGGAVPGVTTALERVAHAAQRKTWLGNEAGWRMAMTRSEGGRNATKLIQAINIFCNMQTSMEDLLIHGFMTRAWPGEKVEVEKHLKYITRNVWLPEGAVSKTTQLGEWI